MPSSMPDFLAYFISGLDADQAEALWDWCEQSNYEGVADAITAAAADRLEQLVAPQERKKEVALKLALLKLKGGAK